MKRIVVSGMMMVVMFVCTAAVFGQAAPAEKGKPAYVGVEKCKACHKTEKSGDQYGKWLNSKHAKAWTTLASPEAKKIAQAKGIDDPQKSDKCVKCHVTAHGVEAKFIDTLTKEEGVSCEACHGPGSEYKALKIMKDHQAAVAAGMIVPNEKTCVKCHNSESPSFKSFVYKDMWVKIAHPTPKEAK
jgi:hypothetical protein